MRIIKVFNNNSVAALSNELGDIIVTGSGVGFQKKIGDLVDENKIEKTYLSKDKDQEKLTKDIENMAPIYYEITNKIVSKANKELETKFYGEIFLAISDHIAFAIKRIRENINLPNIILNDIKALYKKEYQIGLWALDYIEKKTKVRWEESEAGYIALYLVNFSMSDKTNNVAQVVTLTKEVLSIIKETMGVDFEEDSMSYARISIHLKYLAERIFHDVKGNSKDTTANIRKMLKENERLALCIEKIVAMIKQCYNYELSPDEQTFLAIHIKNNAGI